MSGKDHKECKEDNSCPSKKIIAMSWRSWRSSRFWLEAGSDGILEFDEGLVGKVGDLSEGVGIEMFRLVIG